MTGPAPTTSRTDRSGPRSASGEGRSGRAVLLSVFAILALVFGAAMLFQPAAQFAAAGFAACAIVTVPIARRDYDLLSPWTLLAVVVYLGSGARGLVLTIGWEGASRSLNELFLLGRQPAYFTRASLWYLTALAVMTVLFLATYRRRGPEQAVRAKRSYTFHSFVPELCLLLSTVGAIAFLFYVRSTGGLDLDAISTKRSNGSTLAAEGVLRAFNGFSAAGLWIYTAYAFQRGPVRLLSAPGAYIVFLSGMAVVMPFYASTRTDTIFILLVAMAIAYASRHSAAVRWRFIRNLVIVTLVLAASMTLLRSSSRQSTNDSGAKPSSYSQALLEATVINRNLGDMQTTAHVTHAVPRYLAYADGATITSYLAAPIPRRVWPDKPVIAPGPVLGRVIYGLDRSGVPPGFVAEMYWNFGYAGILLGSAAFGWLLGSLHRRLTSVARRGPAATVLYAAVPLRVGGYIMGFAVGTGFFNLLIDSVPVIIGLLVCGRIHSEVTEPEASPVGTSSRG